MIPDVLREHSPQLRGDLLDFKGFLYEVDIFGNDTLFGYDIGVVARHV